MMTATTVTLRCWRCGRRLMDVRGDAHVVTLCQRCNARNEITVSGGQVVESTEVSSGV